MKIIELTREHRDLVKPLFYTRNYMGTDLHANHFSFTDKNPIDETHYKLFLETYLSELHNYKALGLQDNNGNIKSLISFYLSIDEPVWYGTMIRSTNDKKYVRPLLDAAMTYNEQLGRLKFYTLWSEKHVKLLRRFAFSNTASERYDYVDELLVPAKTKCIYTNYWQILFGRTLLPIDTVVRCTFLKQEYRKQISIGGNI